SLKPVTFYYTSDIDPKHTPQFGLIAEEVEKVNPDLVVRDPEGKAYTVRYEAINAMLLNEFLKQHRNIAELQAVVERQQKEFQTMVSRQQDEVKALAAALDEQKTVLQTVKARLDQSVSTTV